MTCSCGGSGNGAISLSCCPDGAVTAWLEKNPHIVKEIVEPECDEFCTDPRHSHLEDRDGTEIT